MNFLAIFWIPTLALGLLVCNIFQIFGFLFFLPSWKRPWYRWISHCWYSLLNFALTRTLGCEIEEFGDDFPEENAFVICNHQAMADIPVIIHLSKKANRTGDLKWFAKSQLKWIPGLGWGLQFLDCLFLDRSWASDRRKIERVFHRLRESAAPFWIVSFLEGTRANPRKIKEGEVFAARKGWKPLQHLLFPRSKGFQATLEGMPSVQAVNIVTIHYVDGPPSLMRLFFHPTKIKVMKRRYTSWPKEEDAQPDWIRERFYEMDEFLGTQKTAN